MCRVLREQGCQVAARTYRLWHTAGPAARTLTDAVVCDAVRDAAWAVDHTGRRRMTPEGLYGRRKMTALVRRVSGGLSRISPPGAIDRAMRTLGLQVVTHAKGTRRTVPGKYGYRAADLLDRDFTAPAPNRTWVMDFTYAVSTTCHLSVQQSQGEGGSHEPSRAPERPWGASRAMINVLH